MKDRNEIIRRLVEAGATYRMVAYGFGLSHERVRRIAKGIRAAGRLKREEMLAKARELYRGGKTIRELSVELGIPIYAISRVITAEDRRIHYETLKNKRFVEVCGRVSEFLKEGGRLTATQVARYDRNLYIAMSQFNTMEWWRKKFGVEETPLYKPVVISPKPKERFFKTG